VGKPSVYPVQRGPSGNTIDTGLYVQIREFNYDGAERWGTSDHRAHTKRVQQQRSDIDREEEVLRKIEDAWGFGNLVMDEPSAMYIGPANGGAGPGCLAAPGPDYDYRVLQTRYYFPKMTPGKFGLHVPKDRPIANKWIYILVGEVGSAKAEAEIYADDRGNWYVRRNPTGARSARIFTLTSSDMAKGVSICTPAYRVTPGKLYQFFLSPVQLSQSALMELLKYANGSTQVDPATIDPVTAEQLKNVTVRRRFQSSAGDGGQSKLEIVDLLDPFAWVEQVTFCDLQPVLTAQFALATDPNEQAKQFICGVLGGLIDARDTDKKEDPFKLVGQLKTNAQPLGSVEGGTAGQWLYRYQQCLNFLGGEVGNACGRVVEWMDSAAHRIVEIACQEELTVPMPGLGASSPLSYGLLHYINVLRVVIGCPAGQDFLARLYMKETERIPYKSVLSPTDVSSLNDVRQDIGGDPAHTLFTLFAPFVIRNASEDEAKVLAAHLNQIEVRAVVVKRRTLGDYFSFVKTVKDAAVQALKEQKIRSLTARLFPASGFESPYADTFKLLKLRGEQVAGLYSVLIGLKVYGEKASDDRLKRFGQIKEECEYPAKVLGFAAKQAKRNLVSYASSKFGVDLEEWAKNPKQYMSSADVQGFIGAEGIEDFEVIAKYYEWVESLEKILEGPFEFFFGVWAVAVQSGETIEAWGQGDFGAAAGKAIQLGGALVATVSGAIALGAEVGIEVELGPPGWLAAVLTVIGTLVVWGFSKNELQKYAQHCFLGASYGEDDGTAVWTEKATFRSLASGGDRFLKQQKCLVNLLGAFRAWLVPKGVGLYRGAPWGGFVQPGYVPPGAKVEVLVTVRAQDNGGEAKDFGVIAIIDLDTGAYVIPKGQAEKVELHAWSARSLDYDDSSWGTDRFGFFSITLKPWLPDGYSLAPKEADRDDWTFNVRLDVNGNGMYIPAEETEETKGASENKYLSLNSIDDVGLHHMWLTSELKSTLDKEE
jgi:hypothetical protein